MVAYNDDLFADLIAKFKPRGFDWGADPIRLTSSRDQLDSGATQFAGLANG